VNCSSGLAGSTYAQFGWPVQRISVTSAPSIGLLRAKKVDLRLVDVPRQLNIGCPEPPVARQLQGEVATGLLSNTPADNAAQTCVGPGVPRFGADKIVRRTK